MKFVRFLLFPFQWLFIMGSSFRKLLYFVGLKKRAKFSIPVICVGNISSGGTGKTPHTKYIEKLLCSNNYNVAIILRGYKRKTKGIVECSFNHCVEDIGDEAMEYLCSVSKNTHVFVSGNRKKGINQILQKYPETQVVIMDDGYQHFGVKAGFYIMLTDYHNLFVNDHVIPIGSLREPRSAVKRANAIVVSKTAKVYSPIIERDLINKINPRDCFFMSYIVYDEMRDFFTDEVVDAKLSERNTYSIFLLTGIANPYPLEEFLRRYCVDFVKYNFKDHYLYKEKDILAIKRDFEQHIANNKIIVTTQKDAQRLRKLDLVDSLKGLPIYYFTISVNFHNKEKNNFDKKILDYVEKNTKHC